MKFNLKELIELDNAPQSTTFDLLVDAIISQPVNEWELTKDDCGFYNIVHKKVPALNFTFTRSGKAALYFGNEFVLKTDRLCGYIDHVYQTLSNDDKLAEEKRKEEYLLELISKLKSES